MKQKKVDFGGFIVKIRLNSIFIIISALFIFISLSNDVHSGIFKKPWADLEVDYLSDVVSSDSGYFDGRWSGLMECGSAGRDRGISIYRKFIIEQGTGKFESGWPGSSGYRLWKIKVGKSGKVRVRGKYVADKLKLLSFSGQTGVDPVDPEREVMWVRGTRGPRTCEAKLFRHLPTAGMKALSNKIPALAEILQMREELEREKIARQKAEQKSAELRKDKEMVLDERQIAAINNEFSGIEGKSENPASPRKMSPDTTPPEIEIFSHDTTRGIKVLNINKKTIIKGLATDESGIVEVLVNNKEALLDQTGNFEIDIYLGIGMNDIIITAMDTHENRASKRITIMREASKISESGSAARGVTEAYYALIIGNDDYKHISKLKNARNDANEIARVLNTLYGFKTTLLFDATRHEIIQAINNLRKDLKENDNLLIYYAGHGIYDDAVGKAYWLPVDARGDDDTNWILAERISSNMRRFLSKHILVVADSCYSGTLTRRAIADFSTVQSRENYLNKMRAKNSRTLMASGGNEPVSDSGGKGHSIFAASLLNGLDNMDKHTFTAEELYYEHIKERVAGNADQTPEYNIIRNSGHDGGDFIFKRKN